MTSPGDRPAGRRREVLGVLQGAPGALGIQDVADQLGVHPNTVRFHLRGLMDSGQVERAEVHQRQVGRPPQLFRAVRRMDPAGPRQYQLLAQVLVEALASAADPHPAAVEVGDAWGRRQADLIDVQHRDPVAALLGLLDDVGFAPERRTEEELSPIALRHCPFLELAESRSDIVCAVHLGLMQGAMAAWSSTVNVERLDPFVEPDRCVAHLAAVGK